MPLAVNVKLQTGTAPLVIGSVHMGVCALEGEGPTATKLTDPVGTAVPPVSEGATVAVKDTCWLTDEVVDVDTMVVVVASLITVCVIWLDVLLEKFWSPL